MKRIFALLFMLVTFSFITAHVFENDIGKQFIKKKTEQITIQLPAVSGATLNVVNSAETKSNQINLLTTFSSASFVRVPKERFLNTNYTSKLQPIDNKIMRVQYNIRC